MCSSDLIARVEPVAEQECRAQLQGGNCDFTIFVETDPRAGVNAFQTVDPPGRPVIVVTTGLLEAIRNADELAFVVGHEAAHHIRQHIPQQADAARRGVLVVDASRHLCAVNGAPVTLTAREMEILAHLMQHPDRVAARPALTDAVYGAATGVSDRTLDSHLRNLRAKLAEAGGPDAIETVHGIGIRMGRCAG